MLYAVMSVIMGSELIWAIGNLLVTTFWLLRSCIARQPWLWYTIVLVLLSALPVILPPFPASLAQIWSHIQPGSPQAVIWGNRRSKIYHWRGCPNYPRQPEPGPHWQAFPTREAAEQAGYRAARNCS